MNFEFATATRIVFGAGKVRDAVSTAASMGTKALIVSGSTAARLDAFIQELQAQNVECTRFSISGEPTIPGVAEGASRLSNHILKELNIKVVANPELNADLIVLMDASTPGQLSSFLKKFQSANTKKMIIDHHSKQEESIKTDYKYVDEKASSTSSSVRSPAWRISDTSAKTVCCSS